MRSLGKNGDQLCHSGCCFAPLTLSSTAGLSQRRKSCITVHSGASSSPCHSPAVSQAALAVSHPGRVADCTLHSTVCSPLSVARTHRLPPTTCSSSSLFPLLEIILPRFLPSLHTVHMVPPQGGLLTPYVKCPPTRYPLSQDPIYSLQGAHHDLLPLCWLVDILSIRPLERTSHEDRKRLFPLPL